MPTLQRFGAICIRMYADDHRPPHFHIVGPGLQIMIRIDDLSVIAGTAPRRRIAAPLAWATANRDVLAAKWRELVERS